MAIELQIGGLGLVARMLKSPIHWIEKRLFYQAYWVSTLYKSHRQRLGQWPHPLATGLEYDVHLGKSYLARPQQTPLLWVRATNDRCYSKVVLTVTGMACHVRHQVTVTLYDVNSVAIQTPIGLPFRDLKFYGDLVDMPYESIRCEVRELIGVDGVAITDIRSEARTLDPMDNLTVALGHRRGDVQRWGELFNCEFMDMEREEMCRRLIGNPFRLSKLRYWLHTKIFSVRWIVSLVFWRHNLVTARHLTGKLSEYLESRREGALLRAKR